MLATKEDTDAILLLTANQLGVPRNEVEGIADIRLQAAGLLALVADTTDDRLRIAAAALAKRLRQFRPASVPPVAMARPLRRSGASRAHL